MAKIGDYTFLKYTPSLERLWNEFTATSRNATFLFDRRYMDYHADRFEDASLIALHHDKPVALLPACHTPDGALCSHSGLTYGGWILPPAHFDGSALLDMFSQWIDYCRAQKCFSSIIYKPVPYIYHRSPSQEEIYALWRCGFTPKSVNLSSAIDMRGSWKFNMSKRQQLRKALKQDINISASDDFTSFWSILETCLRERHEAAPVHSLHEISRLAATFPDNIRLFTLSDDQGLQAGVCIYDTGLVAHSQYAATTPRARERYYLTALYHYLLTDVYADRHYFDFGTSNEEGGHILNSGLLNQKFSMGATGVVYECHSLKLS